MIQYADIPTEARDLIDANYTEEGAVIWWNNRNTLLDNRRPCDMWATGPYSRRQVLALLLALSEGVIM